MASSNNKLAVATIVAAAVIFITISTANAQGNTNYYAEKPGSCAPPLPVDICSQTCFVDGHCRANAKCCPTSCGGTICARPVTMIKPSTRVVKRGSCPAIPTGRWVCTPTCASDGDCPGIRKCCKNRCGATACQKPEEQPLVPVVLDGGDEERPAPNPFLVYAN